MEFEEMLRGLLDGANIELPDTTLPEPDMVNQWKLIQDRKFYLDYEIDGTIMGLQRAIFLINQADKDIAPEERKPIWIYIMSGGGFIDYTYALIDLIKLSKTPVYTVNLGMAGSGAGLIFMSGHKRFSLPTAKVVIHEGSTEMKGDATKVLDAADSYKEDIKYMKNFILSNTQIPKALINKKHANDWTLNTEECLKYSVCDRIIESLDEVM